jgi:CelD/BcsL family acetyltransferase involved in cellulose biosynthesis
MTPPVGRVAHVVGVDPRSDSRWLQLARRPVGSVFVSPRWINAICATYGFTPQARVLLDDGGEPVAGVSWMEVRDFHGARLSSIPFCDRAEPIVDDLASWRLLTADVLDIGLPFTLRCFADSVAATDPDLVKADAAAWHGTALDRAVGSMYARISPTARRNVAAARRSGVVVTASEDLEAVQEFHRLHVGLRKRKYRLLAQPRRFFDSVWERFSVDGSIVTMLARVEGRTVAGAIYLRWNDVLYYKFGSSIPEFLSCRPNDAVAWSALDWAVEHGLSCVDWGLSSLNQPGLIAYKRKWASTEKTIVTLRRLSGEPTWRSRVDQHALRRLTRLLTASWVPDPVTAQGGSLLYRYFC